jgi:hypothetical protein
MLSVAYTAAFCLMAGVRGGRTLAIGARVGELWCGSCGLAQA